jgi:hypothetical protein
MPHKNRPTLVAVLMAAMVAMWVGVVVPLAFADEDGKAPVAVTGQTHCWNDSGTAISCTGTGQDGEVQAGVSCPTPRFPDQGNGTVKDNLTTLL